MADPFAVAARLEYLSDPDGHFTGFAGNDIDLVTATLTLDWRPADFLILRLDNRIDWVRIPLAGLTQQLLEIGRR